MQPINATIEQIYAIEFDKYLCDACIMSFLLRSMTGWDGRDVIGPAFPGGMADLFPPQNI